MIRKVIWIDALDEGSDPVEETRLTLLLERLEKAGIDVERWDALSIPEGLRIDPSTLPALMIDREVKCAGIYPTAEEWRKWIDFDALPRSCGCAAGGCSGCLGSAVCHGA